MFDDVAAKYDLTNDILSAGNAPLWRVATVRAVDPQQGEKVLDIAAGTGTSA
ncbi:ubiquinone biosynthesis methyltransferase UbiE, partial [Curtobacterium oceanosedimentum]